MLLGGTLQVGKGVELVHQPLRMHPAQRMLADVKLAGIVADDDRLAEKPVIVTAPHSAPSVAISTGSGVTGRSVMPRWSRWAIQAVASANRVCGWAARRRITGPASARLRM